MIVLVVLGSLVGVGLAFWLGAWWLSERQVARRAMRALPRQRVRDVAEGTIARVVGTVESSAPLVSPLSKLPCVYWHIVVEESRPTAKGGSVWHPFLEDEQRIDFAVRDATGEAWVRVANALPLVVADGKASSSHFRAAPPELEAFLASHGTSGLVWTTPRKLRCREAVVAVGETVSLAGLAHWERDPDGPTGERNYREGAPLRLVLSSPPRARLILTDEPKLIGSANEHTTREVEASGRSRV
jgi:hypothetical protein